MNDNSYEGHNANDAMIGIRVPLGLAFLPATAPLEFFLEIVPILDVLPDTDFDINGAIGVRFYFRYSRARILTVATPREIECSDSS